MNTARTSELRIFDNQEKIRPGGQVPDRDCDAMEALENLKHCGTANQGPSRNVNGVKSNPRSSPAVVEGGSNILC